MKKTNYLILTCLIAIFIASSSCANNFCYQRVNAYVGIVGGANSPSGKYRAFDRISGETHRATLGGLEALGGGVVGVQTYSDNFFIAVQGNLLYNSASRTLTHDTDTSGIANHTANLKNDFQWGADLRLGYAICQVTPYILGGFATGHWSLRLENNSGTSNFGIPANSVFSLGKSLWGPKVGGGITFSVDSYMVNFEYSYTWFGSINRDLTDSLSDHTWNHHQSIQQGAFLVGINWLF
ncbi:MAG: hypothetical protein P4L16_07970 [Chlamydiales bacterium]|nr:hypothetical protein [Chlamydiales bacterium]